MRSPSPLASRARRCAVLLASLATLAVLAGPTAAPAAAQAPGCGLDPTNGTVTRTLGDRTYELRVPQGLTGSEVPLLLSLHGFGSNGRQDEQFTGWSQFAASHNFIVAYPNGRGGPGSGSWDPYSSTSPDVAFLRHVVDDISARWCVDPRRVHADGWSNGAVMSQRLACEAADRFASVTSYGGGTPTLGGGVPCNPSRPISVGLFVGQFDFTYGGLAQNVNEWRAINSCSPTPVRTTDPHGTLDTYNCVAGTEVLGRVVSNTSHNWPSGAKGEDQRNRMWAFFQANPLP
jgi:polyhydroxybutyrate depolymerase